MLVWNGYQYVNVPDMGAQVPPYGAQAQGGYINTPQQQTPAYGANNAPKLNTNIVRVYGIDGARNYQLPPNSDVMLYDNDRDIVYRVTVDGTGKRDVVMLDLSEHKEEPPIDFSAFATKEDIAKLRDEFASMTAAKPTKKSLISEE